MTPEQSCGARLPLSTYLTLRAYGDRRKDDLSGFFWSLLANDLMSAILNADSGNLAAIGDICLYIYNYMPSGCHGSKSKVTNWIKKTRKQRRAESCPNKRTNA